MPHTQEISAIKSTALGRLQQHLHLLFHLTRVGILIENDRAFLGFWWQFLSPLAASILLVIVFGRRLGSGIEHYALYVLLGMVLWNFFHTGTIQSMRSIVRHTHLLKAVAAPKYLIVLSSVCISFANHCCEMMMFLVLAAFVVHPTPALLLLPIVEILLIIFVCGMGFLLAGLYVFLRDLDKIWPFLLKLWWFATPIVYGLTASGPGIRLNAWNPLYHFLTAARAILISGTWPSSSLMLLLLFDAFVACFAGMMLFWRLAPSFEETV